MPRNLRRAYASSSSAAWSRVMFYSTEIKYQALHQGFIEGVHLHADFEAVRDASSLPARWYVGAWWGSAGRCGPNWNTLMLSGAPHWWFECLRSSRRAGRNLPGSVIDPLSQTAYVREEAGTQRYSVGTDTPKLLATSCGGVPLANSFLAA